MHSVKLPARKDFTHFECLFYDYYITYVYANTGKKKEREGKMDVCNNKYTKFITSSKVSRGKIKKGLLY